MFFEFSLLRLLTFRDLMPRLISHSKIQLTTLSQIKLHDAQIFSLRQQLQHHTQHNTNSNSNNKSKSFYFSLQIYLHSFWVNFFTSPFFFLFLQCVILLHTFAFHETLDGEVFSPLFLWMLCWDGQGVGVHDVSI